MPSAILSAARLNSMEMKTAVPTAPPMERKKAAEDVPTPMSRGGTETCMARVSGCMQKPRPTPKNTAISPGTHRPVSTPKRQAP